MTELLLIHPPAIKACEPPPGLAVLAGALRQAGHTVAVADLNLAAYLYLLAPQRAAAATSGAVPTSVQRALRHGEEALQWLRSPAAIQSFSRYSTALHHLQTLLSRYGEPGERLSLGDYEHPRLNPFVPADLQRVAGGGAHTLFAPYFRDVAVPEILATPAATIAFSINYRHQLLPAFELAGMLRRQAPHLRLVAGGGMITSWQRMLTAAGAALPPFDHVVFGPGEEPLHRLLCHETTAALLSGAAVAFQPDFSDFDLTGYLSPRPVLPVSASRGCYWGRCRFCPEAAAPTHPFAVTPPAALPELLLRLAGRYQVRDFHLIDNAIPLPALRALAGSSARLAGLNWHGFVRFESALIDARLLQGLRQSGCALLQLGLESGSQALLHRMAKGTQLETVEEILSSLQRAGIAAYVYVMAGMPGESAADAAATRAFLLRHAGVIGFLNLALMNLPRDAELLDAIEEHGIAEHALLDDAAPLGLYRRYQGVGDYSRSEARRFLSDLKKEPEIAAILRRTPPWLTSNHAFFFPPHPPLC